MEKNFLYPIKGKANTPFWEGLRDHKFLLPRCQKCGEIFFPPRLFCPECLSDRLEHLEAKGTGTLYAFTEMYVSMLGFDPPYIIGLIELEENPGRFLSKIDAPYESLRIGMKMKIKYVKAAEDLTLHNFVPLEEG